MSEETNKLIEEKIEELYNSLMEKPLRVLDIFNDFFGEERVDMQGYTSLEGFKVWMTQTPIGMYIPRGVVDRADISPGEWHRHHSMTIDALPVSLATEVISLLSLPIVIDEIAHIRFSNIFILVHFPHVRITNENDRFVDINHLWAKVVVFYNGTMNGGFGLNRSEYTLLHMSSNYMHSHISYIPKSDFTIFQTPCTGKGPINGTIATLNRDCNEDIWKLFCLELSKYVTVESINGTPYHYLERLGTNNAGVVIDRFTTCISYYVYYRFTKLKKFVRYFINTKKLKFNYVNGSYSIGMSVPEYFILISNEFISWYNDLPINERSLTFDELKSYNILTEGIINNGKIYLNTNLYNASEYLEYIGKEVCTFKGRKITINITDFEKDSSENKPLLLNIKAALYILQIILKVLNYKYGRKTDTTEDANFGTEVRYL